jgi:peptidoglycan/xylan/chitin deacetylase (PgdA/CDA1 family)
LTHAAFAKLVDAPTFPAGFPKRVALLYSDVTAGTYLQYAVPILHELDLRATLGIEISQLGEPWAMTVPQLHDLQAQGFEVASHSFTHPDLTNVSPTKMWQEIADSKAVLAAKGFAVPHFIYPLGAWNGDVIEAVKAAGYTSARGTGASSIAGGGYAAFDRGRHFAVGCALPTTATTMDEFLAYAADTDLEVEDVFVAVQDVGAIGPISDADFGKDKFRSVDAPDPATRCGFARSCSKRAPTTWGCG